MGDEDLKSQVAKTIERLQGCGFGPLNIAGRIIDLHLRARRRTEDKKTEEEIASYLENGHNSLSYSIDKITEIIREAKDRERSFGG